MLYVGWPAHQLLAASRGVMDKIRNKLRSLVERYPTMQVIGDELIRGSLPIEEAGNELDRFSVEIDFNPLRQWQLPKVRETGGRIPHHEDRHINVKDGTACVCLPEEYFLRHPGPFDPFIFLDGPVRDFFIGQALVARGDPWQHGEWKHGDNGRKDWLDEFLKKQSPVELKAYLESLAHKELKGHHLCPCGSHKKNRNCHLPLLNLLRIIISPIVARKFILHKL